MFGRYELHDLLGRGGMGEVYRALDTVRDRTVALKLLPRHLATDENFKTRFRRESRMAAKLNDPHIIPIHDFGEIDGQLFIDMRLVEGRDLGSVLAERGSLPVATAVKIISQVATALDAAHQNGLVHRDVKPSNVLLAGWTNDIDPHDVEPFAYLVDFGIARAANQEGTALTATSGTVGTVAYMSPERIGGSPGDRRTDIYALGCVLFETLTGHKPFDGEMFAIMYAHMNTPPPRVTGVVRDAPPALDGVIAKAMAKEPEQRFATAGEFALAARQALRSGPGQPQASFRPPPPQAPSRQGPPLSGPIPSGPVPSGTMPSGPMPSGTMPSGAMPSGAMPSGPMPSGPMPSGPMPSGPIPSGPPSGRVPAGAVPSGQPPAYLNPPPQQGRPPQGPPPTRQQTPLPAGPPRSAPPGPPPSGPQQPYRGQPPYSGPPPKRSGGPPPGPVRPTTPSEPVRRPGDWTPPPPAGSHPSGPLPQPELPRRSGRGSKRALIGGGALAAVVAVVLTLVFTLGGGGGGPSSQGSSSSSSGTISTGPVAYRTGTSSTPAVSWDHFGSFTPLVGTRNGDTATAFKHGSCQLKGHLTDDPDGLVDQAECTYSSSPVQTAVARFASAAKVTAFIHGLTDKDSYRISPFRIGGHVVGLRFVSPVTAPQVDVLTYFCGLPTYLVQFFVDNTNTISRSDVLTGYWGAARILDLVPQECNSDFSGPATGSAPLAGGGGQAITSVDEDMLKAYVRRQNADWNVTLVHVPVGSEIAVVGQKQYVAFWTWNKTNNELVVDGSNRYPYNPKLLGPPQATGRGALLTGMKHATFIVTGTFSTDGSGNAVAYTTLDGKSWYAIKAQPDGNLKPVSGFVGVKGIGLSEDFGFDNGLLVTSDCRKSGSSLDCSNPIVKNWRWNSSRNEFVRDH